MRGARGRGSGDRGVSSSVTHVLALGITAILVSGLLMSAGALLEDQRENSAREQLRTVGNRIAGDLSRAAVLAQDGGNVSIETRHPDSVAGREYNVQFLTGSDCQTDLFDADACLDLTLQDGRTSVLVPVRNETDVTFERLSDGTYNITATANESAEPPSVPGVKMDLRVGIGDDVGEFSSGDTLDLTNQNPIAGFTFTPGQPSTASIVRFENDTKDLDGVIANYEWDLGDGTVVSGPDKRTVNHSYSTPGKYTVTLTVTDNNGGVDTVSKVVSVGGLVFNDDDDQEPLNASAGYSYGTLEFTITNFHGEAIAIQEVLIDPADDSVDWLDAEDETHEVLIEGDIAQGGHSQPEQFYDAGRIYDIKDDGMGQATIDAYSTVDVSFNGFDRDSDASAKANMDPVDVDVTMRYIVNGSYHTAQFTLDGPSSGNDPPEPKFVYSCTGTTCQFDDDNSYDSDTGDSITNYAWNLGDGTTVSGPSATNVPHTFPANGSYDVSLTVTDEQGVSATVTKNVQIGDLPPPVIFAVNAGGTEYTGGGVTYERDTESNPSPYFYTSDENRVESTGSTITGTSNDELYQTGRFGEEPACWGAWCWVYPGSFGYDVQAPNGVYEVTFHFAEIESNVDPGEREFHVREDGSTIINGLDVYDQVGEDTALDYDTTFTVDDGSLTLEFDPNSNERAPMVNGIVARLVDAVAFQEDTGDVVMEAENYHRSLPGSGINAAGDDMSNDAWVEVANGSASPSGNGRALEGQPNNGDSADDTENGPRLDYYVDFDTTGTHYVWVRMYCPSAGSADDSIHVGLDGEPATYGGSGLNGNSGTPCRDTSGWIWASHAAGSQASFDVDSTGEHTVNVWMNDDGVLIDKIVVTTQDDGSYQPIDDGPMGPAESVES